MRGRLGNTILLLLLLVGLVVATIGIYHDLTHTCLGYGPGGIPPTFTHCVEWSQ